MSKNLYDEAIAEAKLLRDTAEQNAKNAIIEAVTPRIRTFIEEQLIGNRSEGGASDVLDDVILDMSDDSPGDKNVILDESALESLLTLFGTDDLTKGESSSAVRGVLRESFNALDGKQQQKLLLAANKLNESIDFFEESGIPNDIREKREISRMPRNDEVLYEVDLDELSGLLGDVDFDNNTHNISENEMSNDEMKAMLSQLGFDDLLNEETLQIDLGDLELEDDALDALRDALSRATITLGGEEEVEEEEVEVEVGEEEGEGGEEDFAAFGEEEAGEDLAEVFEIDEDLLRSELNRLRTHLHEAKDFTKVKGIKNDMKDSWGGKGHGNVGVKSSYGGKSGGNAGVKGAFGGGKEVGDPLKVTLNKLSEAVHNERRKNRALASRLNEYRSAVETLREQLDRFKSV